MKDESGKLTYKGTEYTLVFNLNVLEVLQDEYGKYSKWGELVFDPEEPNIKALTFGLCAMINEGINIENEDNGTNRPLITHRMAGRIASELGIAETATVIGDTIEKSSPDDESKNA